MPHTRLRRETPSKSKSNHHICADFRNPKLWRHSEMLVQIDRSGKAVPVAGLPVGATRVIETVLNLNAPHLVNTRQAIMSARRKAVNRMKARNHGLTRTQRADIGRQLRQEAVNAEYPSTLLALADSIDPPRGA